MTIYNANQKFVVSTFVFFFFLEINTFIQEGCVTLIKSHSKDLYFYVEHMLLFLTLCSSKNQIKSITFQKNNMKQHNRFKTHKSAY